MLAPLLMLNVPQATTLCVRGHGDMALELLVEGHCTCEMAAPDAGESKPVVDAASRGVKEGGWPCLDIPIPTSSCDHRVSLAADSQSPCLAGAGGPDPAMMEPPCAAVRGLRAFPTPPAPLETILLQV
jgi:hypothetical protein